MYKEELIDLRQRMRHSAAHVMADVVKDLYPEAKLAIGPPTEDGFYYDFLMETPFSDADLKKIEKQMRRVINKKLPFVFAEYSREEMLEMNKDGFFPYTPATNLFYGLDEALNMLMEEAASQNRRLRAML